MPAAGGSGHFLGRPHGGAALRHPVIFSRGGAEIVDKFREKRYEDKAFDLRDYFNQKYQIDVEQIVADTFNLHKHTHTNDNRAVFLILPPTQNFMAYQAKRSIV